MAPLGHGPALLPMEANGRCGSLWKAFHNDPKLTLPGPRGYSESGHSSDRRTSSIRCADQLAGLLLELLKIDQHGEEIIIFYPVPSLVRIIGDHYYDWQIGAMLLDLTEPQPLLLRVASATAW